jgi:hypothetical protein
VLSRELLRARMEARHASTMVTDSQGGEVVPLDRAS